MQYVTWNSVGAGRMTQVFDRPGHAAAFVKCLKRDKAATEINTGSLADFADGGYEMLATEVARLEATLTDEANLLNALIKVRIADMRKVLASL